jgi:succinate dehydrogenase/fumarate reductase flavoprotein subunit
VARTTGVLRNAKGEAFFLKYAQEHGVVGEGATLSLDDNLSKRYGRPFIELVPYLIKASMKEIREGRGKDGAVFLDLTKVPKERWFADSKGIFTQNLLRGFDLQKEPLPVAPICIGDFKGGGVRIDERGRTDLPGLFAAGDVSPGSSLLYALVTGVLAGRSAVNRARQFSLPELDAETNERIEEQRGTLGTILNRKSGENGDPKKIKTSIKAIMWHSAGPLRDERGLKDGIEGLKELEEEAVPKLSASGSYRRLREAVEAINMLTVSQLILPASLYRTESRSFNQRVDYPERDDKNWLNNTVIKRSKDGSMGISSQPVDLIFLKPDGYEGDKNA